MMNQYPALKQLHEEPDMGLPQVFPPDQEIFLLQLSDYFIKIHLRYDIPACPQRRFGREETRRIFFFFIFSHKVTVKHKVTQRREEEGKGEEVPFGHYIDN